MTACSCSVELGFPDEAGARIAFEAIQPELRGEHERRSHVEMHTHKNVLAFKFVAGDPTALKAALNSYLKLVQAVTGL